MFLNESYGAEKFVEIDQVIRSEFDLVLCTLIDSYFQIVKDRVKTSHLEEIIRNILLEDYLRIIKHKYDIGHLGFHAEVATINSEYKTEGFLDIKVTNVASGTLGYNDEDLCFTIECKRLDPYAQKINYYIQEGICRFIRGKYAKNMTFACMVGFVEKGKLNDITSKLNVKLDTIKKYNLEKLVNINIYKNFAYSYRSKHKRVKNNDINLYHLIFDYTHIIN